MNADAVDGFAGCGGVALGMHLLGLTEVGIEWSPAEVATRRHAGFPTIHGDVARHPMWPFAGIEGMWMSPPCFPPDVIVLTARGMIPIGEVLVGDEVLTHRNRWREVTGTMRRRAPLVRVGALAATADHPFWTRQQVRHWNNDKRGYAWSLTEPGWTPYAEAGDQGHFAALPTEVAPLPVPDPPDWPDVWWVVGRWLADGWASEKRSEVMLGIGKAKASEVQQRLGSGWNPADMPTSVRFTLTDHSAPSWLTEHFGKGAGGKRLPGWAFGMPEGDRRALLDGYLSGDGHITPHGAITASSVSRGLATSMRLLANGLGFTTSLSEYDRGPTCVIEGRTVNQRPTWALRLNADDGRYTRIIGPHRWVKMRKGVQDLDGEHEVVDLTVAGDESFIADGFVVHNCPSFSTAGKGSGHSVTNLIESAMSRIADGQGFDGLIDSAYAVIWETLAERPKAVDPAADRVRRARSLAEMSMLVVQPLRWARYLRPRWIACEQVPPVEPIWRTLAHHLETLGYHTWVGRLSSECYGVPQTRDRAYLMAHLDHPVNPPAPTHQRYRHGQPAEGSYDFVTGEIRPWISMAEALGWGFDESPSRTPAGARHPRWAYEDRDGTHGRTVPRVGLPRHDDLGTSDDGYRERDWRDADEPAFTLTGKAGSWQVEGADGVVVEYRRGGERIHEGRKGSEPSNALTGRVDRWQVNTRRDWRPDGYSQVREGDQPAPTVSPQSGGQWQIYTGTNSMKHNRDPEDMVPYSRPMDDPAPTVDIKAGGAWRLRPGGGGYPDGGHRRLYDLDEPAPTVAFGHDAATWCWERPATTLAADPRAFQPGGHMANDGRNNDAMVGRSEGAVKLELREAAVLQSFPANYHFAGTRTSGFGQVGNACCPRVVAAIVGELTGLDWRAAIDAAYGSR